MFGRRKREGGRLNPIERRPRVQRHVRRMEDGLLRTESEDKDTQSDVRDVSRMLYWLRSAVDFEKWWGGPGHDCFAGRWNLSSQSLPCSQPLSMYVSRICAVWRKRRITKKLNWIKSIFDGGTYHEYTSFSFCMNEPRRQRVVPLCRWFQTPFWMKNSRKAFLIQELIIHNEFLSDIKFIINLPTHSPSDMPGKTR